MVLRSRAWFSDVLFYVHPGVCRPSVRPFYAREGRGGDDENFTQAQALVNSLLED